MSGFKRGREDWHRANIEGSLNKYSVIPLFQKAAEDILEAKPDLIGKGFRKAGSTWGNPMCFKNKQYLLSLLECCWIT